MDRRRGLDRVLNVLLTCSAIVLVGAVVHREVRRPGGPPAAEARPKFHKDWKRFIPAGHVISGSTDAPVVLIEFSDFECPFCRRFNTALATAQNHYGDKLGVIYVHYPLSSHRFAIPAARAAECANAESRFLAFHDALFAKQDSLGLKSWRSYAEDVGIKNLARFSKCAADTSDIFAITDGLRIGQALGVRGTPTVMVNGWIYSGGMDSSRLVGAIDDALAGRQPK